MAKKANHFWIEPDELSRKGIDFCSLEAQGLWLKVMRLLHASERYGYLSRDGKPVSDEQTARRCGIDFQKWTALVAELVEFDLLKRSNDGILFSPELVAQAEWRSSQAKRQKTFQDNKRKTNAQSNGKTNGEYNGYITTDSPPNFKHKSNLSSERKITGGKEQPTAAGSQNFCGTESLEDYLARKQSEFPHFKVSDIYKDFSDKCGSAKYPNLKNTSGAFDRWIESQEVEFSPASNGNGGAYTNPSTGKTLK